MQRIVYYMNFGLKHILNGLMALLVVTVFTQILFRYVFSNPIAWTEELSRYSMVWLTFLGAAYAVSLMENISIDVLRNLLPLQAQKILYTVAALVTLVFCFYLVQYGFILASSGMSQLSAILRVPMGIVYSVIPISAILFAVNTIDVLVKEWKREEKDNGDITV